MKTEFKLGDKVINRDGELGIGIVVAVEFPGYPKYPYPIEVEFDGVGRIRYTTEGKLYLLEDSLYDIEHYKPFQPKVVEEATVTLKISELRELLEYAREYTLQYEDTDVVYDKDVDQIIREVESKHIMNMNIS